MSTTPTNSAPPEPRTAPASAFDVAGRTVGDGFTLIAGPCTVESREQTLAVADVVAAEGASMLRGGAYKPRSSPYSFQGLGREGLAILAEAKARTGLPIVTELIDVRDVEDVVAVADVDPGRRPEHAELPAADRGRPQPTAPCCSSAGSRRRSTSC